MGELAQYKQIYGAMRQQIVDSIYAQGDMLPSEHTLCSTCHVA